MSIKQLSLFCLSVSPLQRAQLVQIILIHHSTYYYTERTPSNSSMNTVRCKTTLITRNQNHIGPITTSYILDNTLYETLHNNVNVIWHYNASLSSILQFFSGDRSTSYR